MVPHHGPTDKESCARCRDPKSAGTTWAVLRRCCTAIPVSKSAGAARHGREEKQLWLFKEGKTEWGGWSPHPWQNALESEPPSQTLSPLTHSTTTCAVCSLETPPNVFLDTCLIHRLMWPLSCTQPSCKLQINCVQTRAAEQSLRAFRQTKLPGYKPQFDFKETVS